MLKPLFALVGLVLFQVVVADVPRVLLVPILAPVTKEGVDLNVPVCDPMATELSQGGKVNPIVWGVTDPIFRAAVMDGKLPEAPDQPTLAQAAAVARALSAEYIITCESKQVGTDVQADIRLLRGGRQIWKDRQIMKIQLEAGEILPLQTARSIARTVALKLQTDPWKSLPVARKVDAPELTGGQAPPTPPVEPIDVVQAKPEITLAKLSEEATQLQSSGRSSAAILLIRDAVDTKPLDPDRRKLLIQTLGEQNPELAAQEARRSAVLMPDHPEFRLLAAQAWMRAGKANEAQADLNEAMARTPETDATRILLAEIALRRGDGNLALGHTERAIKESPSAQAHLLRAFARAILGGEDGVRQDLVAAQKLSPEQSPAEVLRLYRLGVSVTDGQFDRMATGIRDLLPRISVSPKAPAVVEALESIRASLRAQDTLFAGISVPSEARTAHAERALAYKLLLQTLMDINAFAEGTPEAIGDARINLGEAVKQMVTARKTWSPANGSTSGA